MREHKGLNLDAFKGEERHVVEAINIMLHELSGAVKKIEQGKKPDSTGETLS